MPRPVPVSLPALLRSRVVPQQPQRCLRQLLTARGESAAGSSEAGHKVTGSPHTSPALHCYRDNNAAAPSGVLGDFAAPRMCIPMCKVETLSGGCKHQMLPKTTLAISPINREAVVGSACLPPSPGCEESCCPGTPLLLRLRAQPTEAAWGRGAGDLPRALAVIIPL